MRIAAALLFAAAVHGQLSGQVSGPVSGFVFHSPSHSIRPIIGVPGSAYLGTAVAQGFDAASVSPQGKLALAVTGGVLYLARGLDTGQPDTGPVDGALGGVDRFAWGPDGVSAVVYSSTARQAQILRHLDGAPTIESTLDFSNLDGGVTSLAFDGKRVLAGAGGVYLADGSGVKLLLRTPHPAAMAVGNRDLFVADQDSNQVWMIADYAGDATPMLFADDRAGLSSPDGLRVSGGSLLIASSGSRAVDAIEISTRAALKHVDLDFAPTRMEAAGAMSLLNSGDDAEPLYVLGNGTDLGVYFVPAGSGE